MIIKIEEEEGTLRRKLRELSGDTAQSLLLLISGDFDRKFIESPKLLLRGH